MYEKLETHNWVLRHPNDKVGFILEDKRNRHLTYFNQVGVKYLYKVPGNMDGRKIQYRSGKIPENIPELIEDELKYINENGEMRGSDKYE